MKIAITGGTGFVGNLLSREMIAKGHEVFIFTRRKPAKTLNANYVEINYQNKEALKENLKGIEAIVHLAAALFARSRNEFFISNALSTKNLIEASSENNLKKFVYISSLAAGGPCPSNENIRTEEMIDNPVSYYGKSKLAAENEVKKFKSKYIILRPPIVYGPKDSGFSTIARYVKKGIMVSPSSNKSKFSFIYLNDLVKAIEKAVFEEIENDKYYVCENNIYEWQEFISKMAENLKVKMPKMINLPKPLMYMAGFSYEILSYLTSTLPVLNRDKVREAKAGDWICSSKKWESKTSQKWTPLSDGLRETFEKI